MPSNNASALLAIRMAARWSELSGNRLDTCSDLDATVQQRFGEAEMDFLLYIHSRIMFMVFRTSIAPNCPWSMLAAVLWCLWTACYVARPADIEQVL